MFLESMPRKKSLKNTSQDSKGVLRENSDKEPSSFNIQVRKTELTWIAGVMVFLLVVLFLTSYLTKSTNTFTYQTLKFEKQLYGTIPIFVYGYTFKDITEQGVHAYQYQLLFRLDPRKNDLPVLGEIAFPFGRDIYISVNTTGFNACSTTSRDFASLSGFLTSNLFNIHPGVLYAQVAIDSNLTQITC